MKNTCTRKSAFTMIEVLIASFISAMALGSACALFFQSSRILNASHVRTDALQKARTAMEYLKSQKYDSTVMNYGNHTMTLNGMPFKYSIAKSPINGNSIKDVTVEVDWKSPVTGQTRQIKLASMLSSPLHQNAPMTQPPVIKLPDEEDDADKIKNNNGHGNNVDKVDSSNPGKSMEGEDSNSDIDDEKGYSDNDRILDELDQFTNGDKKHKDWLEEMEKRRQEQIKEMEKRRQEWLDEIEKNRNY